VLLLVGCEEPGDRQSLKGTVTFEDVPLTEGHIKFLPQRGTKGSPAGGKITAGHFSILPDGGTFTGTFRVEITAARQPSRPDQEAAGRDSGDWNPEIGAGSH
jgi:hypothetical protein